MDDNENPTYSHILILTFQAQMIQLQVTFFNIVFQ